MSHPASSTMSHSAMVLPPHGQVIVATSSSRGKLVLSSSEQSQIQTPVNLSVTKLENTTQPSTANKPSENRPVPVKHGNIPSESNHCPVSTAIVNNVPYSAPQSRAFSVTTTPQSQAFAVTNANHSQAAPPVVPATPQVRLMPHVHAPGQGGFAVVSHASGYTQPTTESVDATGSAFKRTHPDEDDEDIRRSGRACKGKLYRGFIVDGRISVGGRKGRRSHRSGDDEEIESDGMIALEQEESLESINHNHQ